MTLSTRQLSTALLSIMVVLGLHAAALAQGNDHSGDRLRGRITAITGNSIDIARRDGSSATIVTTGNTTFTRNGQPASLSDFVNGDLVAARGTQNGNGAFVADAVRGGTRPPAPHDSERTGGQVVSVDASQGSITVTTRDGATEVIYTTAETQILRNRQPATVADFAPGDRLRARGDRDPDENFIADRILGGSGRGQ
jgi:hypothetical protein